MEFRKKGLLFVVVAFANFVTLLGIVQILSVFHEVWGFFFRHISLSFHKQNGKKGEVKK